MRKFKLLQLLIILLAVVLLPVNLQAQEIDNDVISVMNNIEYSYFFKHLEYLASDDLKGRDVGTEDFEKAAVYVADEFKNNGLLPFGDNGTYFQEVAFSKPSIVKSSIQFQVEKNSESINGIYGENVSILVSPKYDKINEKQKLVFVGYGNILPEDSINDYEGVDVKGKTVIVTLGGPKSLENPEANDLFAKIHNAEEQGATGIILFYPKGNAFQKMIFNRIHEFLSNTRTLYLADTSITGSMLDIDLKIGVFAKKEFINELFKFNGLDLKKELKNMSKGNSSSQELECVLNCSYDITKESVYCKNVVALLPGTDSTLKNEYVVLGGHLDHLGVGKAVKGDSIYNGMWDNATGSAAVISIAKAYKDLSKKPKRSIIFVCFTAEEKGLLGSNYYANRNNVTDGKIIANVNIDMLGNLFETTDVIPLGYSHSNLSEAVDFAAGTLNIKIDDNKKEEDDYIERSDQISFIRNGIPALNLGSGYTASNPKIDGKKQVNKWMKKKYHSPFDDLNQEYSDKTFLTFLKLHFLTMYYITNTIEEVKWKEDSWLYEKYVLKEKK